MADTLDTATPARRRRSDARRSINAIVSAARTVLGERPDASMEDIAVAAGVTRQTVYAHFPSRDALMAAVVEAIRTEGLATLDPAYLDTLSPTDALAHLIDIGWQMIRRYPPLLDPAVARIPGPDGSDPHEPVTPHLERIIRRGQRAGDFDRSLPIAWIAAAIFGLGHAAAEQMGAGLLDPGEARAVLLESVLRLCGAGDAR
jgi:AcrR family transcriptional regulator